MIRSSGLKAVVAVFALLAGVFTVTGTAKAEWLRAESTRFIVYADANEREIRRRTTLLEDFDRLLQEMTGRGAMPSPNKLVIYMVDGDRELNMIRPSAMGVAGFYTASPLGIMAVSDRNNFGPSEWSNEILLHEYTHHFMMQYFPGYYPPWYVEGFAEYFQTARFTDQQIEVGRFSTMRAYTLVDPSTRISIERVMFPREGRRTPEEENEFYATSWLLAHFMLRSPTRQPQLVAYLTAVGRGTEARAAFRQAFGAEPAALDRELRAYLRTSTFTRYRRASTRAAPSITVTPVGVSDTIMLADAALHMAPRRNGATLLDRVRRAAGSRTDLFTRRTLATAELYYGERARAEAILTDLLRQSPEDAELLYLRGMVELARARDASGADAAAAHRSARLLFGRAHRANGNHFQTLYRYAQSMAVDETTPSENTMNVLLLARSLAPQVDEIAFNAALALIERQQYADAAALLTPLAASPHANNLTRSAAFLLTAARERRAPDFAAMRAADNSGDDGEEDGDAPGRP